MVACNDKNIIKDLLVGDIFCMDEITIADIKG